MKLKVCQICELFLLLTVFCTELNYLKCVYCSESLMKRNKIVHKNYEKIPIDITRSGLITKRDATKINQINNKSLWLNSSAHNKLSNKTHSKDVSFIKGRTTAAEAVAAAITATSQYELGDTKEYLNINEPDRVRTRGKTKRKKNIAWKKIKSYEDESAKAINVKQKRSSIHSMRQKRQGRRQQEIRRSFDPVNKQTISQKQNKILPEESMHRVAVLMPTSILNVIPVQQGFRDFVDFFQVNLHNVSFDFLGDNSEYCFFIFSFSRIKIQYWISD